MPDTLTPVDEIVAAFDDLVRAGKILHGGLSNFPPGGWRPPRPARTCATGPGSSASRSSTASPSAPPTANCCRWRRRSASAPRCTGRWRAAC
ncbi:hypothetical protein NKH77_05465 [Streptomyces sp. M19]